MADQHKFVTRFSELTLGDIYVIRWMDHFSTDDLSSEDAVKHESFIFSSVGHFIGHNPYYIILAHKYHKPASDSNDNMHILKRGTLSIKKMTAVDPMEDDFEDETGEPSEAESHCRP